MAPRKAPVIRERNALPELAWEEIDEPGAYVDLATGALYRVPARALVKGAQPPIRKESAAGSQFVQVSKNPYILSLEARMICAERDIQFNF